MSIRSRFRSAVYRFVVWCGAVEPYREPAKGKAKLIGGPANGASFDIREDAIFIKAPVLNPPDCCELYKRVPVFTFEHVGRRKISEPLE